MTRRRRPPIDRFMEKVRIVRTPGQWGFCWVWTGAKDTGGYGAFQLGVKKLVLAHRWSYEHFIGPIPAGKQLDHFKCFNHACVNPKHLRPATPLENTRNGPNHNANKTHCLHGHPYDKANTRLGHQAGKPHQVRRSCRACERVADAKRRRKDENANK